MTVSVKTDLIHVYSGERDNEVIRRVRIWSATDRVKLGTDGYQVRVGVATPGTDNVDWIGVWNQQEQSLIRNTPRDMSGIDDINFPIAAGQVCIVQIITYGEPQQYIDGVTVEWKFNRIGELKPEIGRRIDDVGGIYARPRFIDRPLFSLGRYIENQSVRSAIEPLESDLNDSGITEWVLSTQLTRPTLRTEAVSKGAAVGPVLNVGAGYPGLVVVSVTLTVPDSTKAYLMDVNAGASIMYGGVGVDHFGAYLADTVNGHTTPPTLPNMLLGSVGFAGALDRTPVSIGDCRIPVPVNTLTVTAALYIAYTGGASASVDVYEPFINARLLRDPYVVE